MHYKDLGDYLAWENERLQLLKSSNLPSETSLGIGRVLLSHQSKTDGVRYLTTSEVPNLPVDQNWIIGTRHNAEFRWSTIREAYIFPRATPIKQKRHIFAWTQGMVNKISQELWHEISPELLGWNMVLNRPDQEDFHLDGLPIWTDFMVYPSDVTDARNKTKLIVNMKLLYFQKGCKVTRKSIADELNIDDPSFPQAFNQASKNFRWAVLEIEGLQWEDILQANQKVFVRLPNWKLD